MPNYKLSKIKQGVKNPNRVNLFLDGKFWIAIPKESLIDYDLYQGRELSAAEKEKIESETQDIKAKERARNYIAIRPRSLSEFRIYAQTKLKLTEEEQEKLIEKLIARGELSDENFARWWVENRMEFSNYGTEKIKAELAAKGVAREITAKVIEDIGYNEIIKRESTKIIAEIEKTLHKGMRYDPFDKEIQKLLRRLVSRGYKFSDVKEYLDDYLKQS